MSETFRMDSEVQHCVKTFIKANVIRVQIALALLIIRTKPDHTTSVQHATNIQARCRLKYSNCVLQSSECENNSEFHDQKMLSLQQEQLISSLREAVPQLATNNMCCYSNDLFETEDGLTEFDIQMSGSDDESLIEQNELNLQFIQAMVKLKSVLNTCSYVPAAEIQNILSTVSVNSNVEKQNESLNPDNSCSQRYTMSSEFHPYNQYEIGFGFQMKRDINISSGTLKYIIHSSDGNRLLINSVKAVLQYLGQNILTDKCELLDLIVKNWKGSLLEFSLNVVLELVDFVACQEEEQNECRKVCLDFICNVVDGILSNDSLNLHPLWTQQCCIIAELGNSKHLCIDFLNYLFDKMKTMSKNIKPKISVSSRAHNESTVIFKSGDMEKSFYIFYTVEKLLKKWKKFQSSKSSTRRNNLYSNGEFPQVHNNSVLDLWRKSWSGSKKISSSSLSPSQNDDMEECLPSKWKDVLEELVINFTEDYPFIALYSFECLRLLQPDIEK